MGNEGTVLPPKACEVAKCVPKKGGSTHKQAATQSPARHVLHIPLHVLMPVQFSVATRPDRKSTSSNVITHLLHPVPQLRDEPIQTGDIDLFPTRLSDGESEVCCSYIILQ
jgi:hypothetical protein